MPSTHQPDHPSAADVPDPAPSRTDTADKLWTALGTQPGSTSAELATAAAIGRSTAAKLLTRWSAEGLVTRTTTPANGQSGRSPERWSITNPATPNATPTAIDPATETDAEHAAHRPDVNPTTADPAAVNLDTDLPEGSTAAAATDVIDAASDVRQVTDSPSTNDAQDDHSTKPSAALSHDAGPSDGPTSRRTRAASGTGRAQRLPAGGLRGLVEDYLREHPDAAFGPSQIGKDLSRSGGAVANALTKLVDAGCAVVVQDKPRRYRLALAETNPPT